VPAGSEEKGNFTKEIRVDDSEDDCEVVHQKKKSLRKVAPNRSS